MTAEEAGAPLVDFVVYAGGDENIEAAVAMIPDGPRTVTVVAKGPRESTPGVRVIVGNRTHGRVLAAAAARAPFVIFVDADVVSVTPEDVAWTVETLKGGASVVAGMLLRNQRVFSAGYCINAQARPYYRFAGWSPDGAKVTQRREDLQAVPIHFMGTRREVLRRVALREEFGEAGLAEADYCIRAKRMGCGPIVYEPRIMTEFEGRHIGPVDMGVVQLLVQTAQPAYDEFALL